MEAAVPPMGLQLRGSQIFPSQQMLYSISAFPSLVYEISELLPAMDMRLAPVLWGWVVYWEDEETQLCRYKSGISTPGGPARRSLSWGQPRGIARLVSRGWRGPTDHRISNSSQSPSDVQNLRNGLRKNLIATTSLPIPIPSTPAILVLVSSNCGLLHRILLAWAWFDKYKSKFSDSTHKRSWDLSFGVLTLGSESKNRNS